jgi:hypothetical protein
MCALWKSKVLSLTGKTPGYPTLAEAEAAECFIRIASMKRVYLFLEILQNCMMIPND